MSYNTLANAITTEFQDFCDTNGYTVRYDNDPRDTPTSGWWLQVKLEFESAIQRETGDKKYRITGKLKIIIRDEIQKGSYQLHEIADKIEQAFSNTTVGSVIFRTASLSRVGRESDNARLDVNIPFQYDY